MLLSRIPLVYYGFAHQLAGQRYVIDQHLAENQYASLPQFPKLTIGLQTSICWSEVSAELH